MKDYEEMAKNVFQRIDEYEAEKKRRKAVITKTVASATSVCAVAAVGVGLWKSGALSSSHDLLISNTLEWSDADVILSEDDDISIDKHDSNDSSINRNNVPATSGTTAYSTSNDTNSVVVDNVSESAEKDENICEENFANNDIVEAYTPSNNDIDATVSDDSILTNNEQQKVTDNHVTQTEAPIQQTTPIQQTEPVTHAVPDNSGNVPDNGGNSPVVFMYTIEWNGTTFNNNSSVDAVAYTRAECIGKASDFNGNYKDAFGYEISPSDNIYTTEENAYVLIAVKADGRAIALTNPAFLDGVVYRTWKDDSSSGAEAWN